MPATLKGEGSDVEVLTAALDGFMAWMVRQLVDYFFEVTGTLPCTFSI